MRATLTALEDLTDFDVGAWSELYARAIEPNPYFAPDFVRAAAEGLDRQDAAILVARSGDDWTGAVPVVRPRSWRRVPLPSLTTWRHSYCLLGTPLLAPDDPRLAAEALVDKGRHDRAASFLALEWMGADGPVAGAFAGAFEGMGTARPHLYERFERATLRRRPGADYLDGRLSPKRAKELRRLRRGLERELGAEVEVRDRAGEQDAVEAFLRLEASGWKGRAGTAMGVIPGHDRFFRDVCASFAAAGRLELLSLEAAGRPLAMQCNLLAGDALFCFKVAYDDALARYSVGVQLELAAIEVFHARTELAWVDSCADHDNELINGLWPDRRALETLAVRAGAWTRHAARPAIAAVDAARRLTGRSR